MSSTTQPPPPIRKIEPSQIGVGERLGTMLLDHFLMTLVAMVFFLPGFIYSFTISVGQIPPDFMKGGPAYIWLFGFALYFCKDCIDGRSIAKRILKLQVVNNSTGLAASPLRCFVRNITCILWPVEVIVALFNTERRLGDRIAGTKLVKFDPSIDQPKVNFPRIIVPIFISYGLMLLFAHGVPNFNSRRIHYIENSYNRAESANLEKLLSDSLGQSLTPEAQVYDSMTNAKVKYIVTILRLKENYMLGDKSFNKLKAQTLALIYSRFPKSAFTGDLIYFYKSQGVTQSWQTNMGTYPLTPK